VERFGKFKIVEELGRGGMGTVYRAQDTDLGREVALKVILEDVLDIPEVKSRFRREAQSLAQIDHENVTILYEFGYQNGQPFMAMQFLQGEDLDKILEEIATGEREPLTLQQKLDIALQICRGLQIAHARGIVHRDIKPANIKVLPDDKVKIMDFGIAKPTKGTLITASGQQIGTPNYMSPEQVRGTKEIDKRSDIFSFGVLFYELLSSKRPFTGSDLYELMHSIVHDKPEKITLPDTPNTEDDLWQVVTKCLEKKAEDRYDHFSQVIADLAPIYNKIQASTFLSTHDDGDAAATGMTKTLDVGQTVDISKPAIFEKKRRKMTVIGIGLVASILVLFLLLRFVGQDSGSAATPEEIASKARDALASLKFNTSELGSEFLESKGYLTALQLEQQGSAALQSKKYDQASMSFKAATDTLTQAIGRYQSTIAQLKKAADAARNRMLVEKQVTQREEADKIAEKAYRKALEFEARADSSYQLNDLSPLERATELFDLARNKFIKARDEADIRRREQESASSANARLRARAEAARNGMLTAKLRVPGSDSDKTEDDNYQAAVKAEKQARQLYDNGDFNAARAAFEQAAQAYTVSAKSITDVLQRRAEKAREDMRTAKNKIKPKYHDESAYQNARQAQQEAENAFDRRDFVKAAESFSNAASLLNALAFAITADQIALDEAITRVRQAYSKSLEAGDIAALQSLYKNFTDTEKEKWSQVFGFTRDREVTIAEDSKTVKDNTAILDLLIKIKYKDNKNRQQELNYAYIWKLEQSDGKWLISEFKDKS